jgi:hypothetical protein
MMETINFSVKLDSPLLSDTGYFRFAEASTRPGSPAYHTARCVADSMEIESS